MLKCLTHTNQKGKIWKKILRKLRAKFKYEKSFMKNFLEEVSKLCNVRDSDKIWIFYVIEFKNERIYDKIWYKSRLYYFTKNLYDSEEKSHFCSNKF